MASVSKAVKTDTRTQAGTRALPRKVQSLVVKAPYAAPEVVSFPIDGMKLSQVTLAGNF